MNVSDQNRVNLIQLLTGLVLALALIGCGGEELAPTATAGVPTAIPPTIETEGPEAEVPTVKAYNLGETTIIQDHFPEESPFRDMPVRLEGVIGVPGGDGNHPVVLIMHGSHASCPGENEWPCSAEEEQKNYEGFTYLVEELAEAGYVALSINVNSEHTFGFGEAPPTVRTIQLINMHLSELAAANEGESDEFGLDLEGRIDLSRMTWLGHSRGGEYANRIVRDQDGAFGGSFEEIQGLILVAPSYIVADSLPAADQATATVVPSCDQDLLTLEGQNYYESARLNPERQTMAASVYLEGANHNNFNTVLEPESTTSPENRPDCAADFLITAEEQQAFLTDYTIDFLQVIYGEPEAAQEAKRRLGIRTDEAVPTAIFNRDAKVNFLPGGSHQLMLIQPQSEGELNQNLLGGDVRMTGLTASFCPQGYYVPNAEPGTELCKRVNFNQPGFPQQLVVNWVSEGAELRSNISEAYSDISAYDAIQLRSTLDPLSDLNIVGEPQTFTIELVDSKGQRDSIVVPELEHPPGVRQPNQYFEGELFTGQVYMESVRIPLSDFAGVDLTAISEVGLLFDQTESGALFIADIALVGGD